MQLAVLGFEGMRGHDFHRALIRIHETVTEVVQKDLDLNAYGGRGMGWLR